MDPSSSFHHHGLITSHAQEAERDLIHHGTEHRWFAGCVPVNERSYISLALSSHRVTTLSAARNKRNNLQTPSTFRTPFIEQVPNDLGLLFRAEGSAGDVHGDDKSGKDKHRPYENEQHVRYDLCFYRE